MSDARRQALRFAMIGAASTALYFGLLMALRPLIPSTLVLTAVCYALSMGFNFLAQGMFTFQVQRLSARQMRRYLLMQGGALVLNSGAMALLVDGAGVHILVAQVFVTGGITVATFLISRSWVYQ